MSELFVYETNREARESGKEHAIGMHGQTYGERYDKIHLPWKSMEDLNEKTRTWLYHEIFSRVMTYGQIVWSE